MISMSIALFCKNNGFTSVHETVRENENGYPYLTFLSNKTNPVTGKVIAENVYFSKKAAKNVIEGTPVNKSMLKRLQVCVTENANGEVRNKISNIGSSPYLSLDDLLGA